MLKTNIVKDKDIGLEYECLELRSDTLPDDIDTFYPRDWFAHFSRHTPEVNDSAWDYIIWNFIGVKEWDVIVKCKIPTDEQIEESELLSYKSDMFLKNHHPLAKQEWRKLWITKNGFKEMAFVLSGEDSILLYGKSMYENFRYLKI